MKFRTPVTMHPAGFNITPLIDILLVLIIFFVLTWNISRDEKELSNQLPTATNAKPGSVVPQEVVLNILANGDVILNGEVRDDETLRATLERMYNNFADDTMVVIRADKAVRYDHIVRVLDLCSGAHVQNVSFATEEPEKPTR